MSRLWTTYCALLFGVVAAAPCRAAQSPPPHHDLVAKAMELLQAEDVTAARPLVEAAVETMGEADPAALLLEARLAFLEGRFEDALDFLTQARNLSDAFDEDTVGPFEDLVLATWELVRDMVPHPSPGGHFVVYTRPGPDEVLVLYAGEALERARKATEEVFGWAPSEPVAVHVYPHVEDLARVSSLRVSEIQASGTIALCKYNRLMITSPADLLYGYEWLDTLAHEYIHYVIIHASDNRVPIWLHEGLAKYFETRWRGNLSPSLSPTSQDLLARAIAEGHLITFDEMSPSMARLPTQEATATAFAEVFTAIRFIVERTGIEGIRHIIERIRDGASDREAIAAVLGMSFERFEKQWRRFMRSLDLVRLPTAYVERLYFRNRDDRRDELKAIGAEKAEQHTYLGDRLRARKRMLAAVKEYRKAVAVVGNTSPVIQAKLATALLALGRAQDALDAVEPALQWYPQYVLLHLRRGQALLKLNRYAEAAEALRRAVAINPFDADVHRGLEKALAALGRQQEADRERRALEILSGDASGAEPSTTPQGGDR